MAISFACRSASSVGGQQVAGDLLADELVVRHVAVERVDDPVAVAVHLRDRVVGVVAGGVGVADDVEPVPAPPLAVGRRREQPSTTFANASGESSVRNASTSSGVGGRPVRSNVARRISVRLSAGGAGVSPFASSFARMKRSIVGERPAASFTAGGGGSRDRLERPELLRPRPGRAPGRRRAAGPRVGAPIFTHASRSAISAVGELLLRRHLQVVVGVPDRLDRAGSCPGRRARRPGRTSPPLSTPVARVEQQLALELLRPRRCGTCSSARPAPGGPSSRRTRPRPGRPQRQGRRGRGPPGSLLRVPHSWPDAPCPVSPIGRRPWCVILPGRHPDQQAGMGRAASADFTDRAARKFDRCTGLATQTGPGLSAPMVPAAPAGSSHPAYTFRSFRPRPRRARADPCHTPTRTRTNRCGRRSYCPRTAGGSYSPGPSQSRPGWPRPGRRPADSGRATPWGLRSDRDRPVYGPA